MSDGKKTYKLLRFTRIAVSLVATAAIFASVALGYDLWLNRWQILPAMLAGVMTWIIFWLVVTAVAGRIYCSTFCPMGTVFDVFARIGHRKRGYFFSSPRTVIRRSITFIAVVALLTGLPVMLNLLDPAAAFSRISVWSAGPLFNAMAFSFSAGAVAFVSLALAGVVAAARGRLLCNTICPVGTVLAEISRFSLYHIDINTDKCIGCGRCTERCKAECIDPSAHTVDAARCIVCFDCTAGCPNSAITYRRGRHRLTMPLMQAAGPSSDSASSVETSGPSVDTRKNYRPIDRREFLATVLAGVPALAFAVPTTDPDIEPLNPVHPPGLMSIENLRLRCTGCGACSAACPTGIIKPMTLAHSLKAPLRPVLEFDTGSCLYDCTRCTHVCPTGTLVPVTVSEKHNFVIGKARVVPRFCIEYNSGEGCGICARRCPRRAISIHPVEVPEATPGHPADRPELTPSGVPRRLPYVDEDACIGCGECRYVCPARPRAFVIEGEQ